MGVRSKVNPAGWGGVRSKVIQPGGGGGSGPASRGGQVQLAGEGVRSSQWGGEGQHLVPLAGGMPLAFTQEDFLVVEIYLTWLSFTFFCF